MNDPFTISGDTPTDQEPPRRPIGQVVFGIVLVGFGLAWLIAATDLFRVPWRAVMAGALVTVGAAVVASAWRERHRGLITVGFILLVLLGLISSAEGILDLPLSGGIGERTYEPMTATEVRAEYRLGIGEIVVDLSEVDFPPGETRVVASVTLGSLRITVPPGIAVHVEGRATAGEVTILGTTHSGTSIDEIHQDIGYADAEVRLFLDARAGLGEVQVRR